MKYDFTSILDRRGKDAVAIDAVGAPGSPYPAPREGFDVIPMWVADMNFPVVPTVQQAMIQRVERMTARQRVRTTAHFTSSAPNLSTFRRVRPSPPW